MSHIDELGALSVQDHDEDVFLKALNEALQEWKKNDLYRERMERAGVPETIDSFGEVKNLPTVDMMEFKEHPRELVVDESKVEDKYALYSSGTTSDSKSFALRSEEGTKRNKAAAQRFSELAPDLDFIHVLSASEELLKNLPEDQKQRALFRFVIWTFEEIDSDFYLEKTADGFEPDVERMIDSIREKDGNQAIFSTPVSLYKIAKDLEKQGVTLDLGSEGVIATGGGWKGPVQSNQEAFRDLLEEVFKISPENHLDFYRCTELFFGMGNKCGDKDPDLKRIPPEGYVWVADEDKFLNKGELVPVDEGEPGLMIGIDPINTDYPGLILTDDIVRKFNGEYGPEVRIEYVGRSSR